MEADLKKKINEIQGENEGTIGVLLVDNLGLPIESQDNFDKNQSGLISSIVKNAAKLEKIIKQGSGEEQHQNIGHNTGSDITAKIYFKEENLVIRHKQGLTLALRQRA